jgi:hypothetical protein
MVDSRGLQKQSEVTEDIAINEVERIELLADLLLEMALEEDTNATS